MVLDGVGTLVVGIRQGRAGCGSDPGADCVKFMAGTIQVGTSGWFYDAWVGPFYPQRTAKSDYLGCYAERFEIVEVDSTYYRTPSTRMTRGWAARTPDRFRFALKVPREITHEKVLSDCEREMDEYLSALEPLGPKVKCVLLQFGYFNRRAFSSAGPFLERLDGFLARYAGQIPIAAEIRNKNWLSAAYFDLLRSHNVVATLVEHAWLPPIDALIQRHDVVTGPFSYLRLIGDRKHIEEITTTWEKVVVDRSSDLRRVAAAIRRLAETTDVVTFVNNHYAGHGPATVADLNAALAV